LVIYLTYEMWVKLDYCNSCMLLNHPHYGNQGFFFFRFCEVGGLVIIYKMTYPNLAIGKRGKYKSCGSQPYLGSILGLRVEA
jgi:hypothetical protein